MSSVTRLIDNARVRLPGALDGMIHRELFNVIDEFCRTTNGYRDMVETDLVAGQSTYEITPDGFEILLVYQAAHRSLPITGATFDDGTIALPNAPTAEDVAEPLITEVSMTPVYDASPDPAEWLPEKYYARWFNYLLDGVLWRMMSQVAKPYSSERLALYHSRRFRNGMAIARTRVAGDTEPNASAWQFPMFA